MLQIPVGYLFSRPLLASWLPLGTRTFCLNYKIKEIIIIKSIYIYNQY